MFSSDPVSRLSTQMTWCPCSTRWSQRCDPRKPAPPVTTEVGIPPDRTRGTGLPIPPLRTPFTPSERGADGHRRCRSIHRRTDRWLESEPESSAEKSDIAATVVQRERERCDASAPLCGICAVQRVSNGSSPQSDEAPHAEPGRFHLMRSEETPVTRPPLLLVGAIAAVCACFAAVVWAAGPSVSIRAFPREPA